MSRRLLIAALLALPSVAAAQPVAGSVSIQLRDSASASGPIATLGEVAELSPPGATRDRLMLLPVGPTPSAGQSLTAFDIRRRIAPQLPAGLRVHWSGASRVVFAAPAPVRIPQAQATPVPEVPRDREVRRLIEARVLDAARNAGVRTDLLSVELLPNQPLPAWLTAEQVRSAELTGVTPPFPREQRFRLLVNYDLERKSVLHLTVRWTQLASVLVLTTDRPAGHKLTQADLAWQTRPAEYSTDVTPGDLIGQPLFTRASAGTPLNAATVRLRSLVRSGDVVTVRYHVGSLTVSRRYVAQSSGARGESVRFASFDRKEKLAGTVIGPRLLSVSPEVATTPSRQTGLRYVDADPPAPAPRPQVPVGPIPPIEPQETQP